MTTIGIDVGGTKCSGVVLDGDDRVLAEHRIPTPRGEEQIVDAIVETVEHLRADAPRGAPVGIGVPGLVSSDGVLHVAPNLPGVADLPVKALVEDALGVPVAVDNDATAACWAERQAGAGRGAADCVFVALGTGIGGGVVLGGQLQRGHHGYAGEFGHMIVDPSGPVCVCGRTGCWERFASGSALGRMAREAAAAGTAPRLVELAGGEVGDVRGEHVTRACAEGDPGGLEVMAGFARWVALGLANLVNAFDPAFVVLGGGLVEAGDLLLAPVRDAYSSLVLGPTTRPSTSIVPAALGEDAGAIGAAMLAR